MPKCAKLDNFPQFEIRMSQNTSAADIFVADSNYHNKHDFWIWCIDKLRTFWSHITVPMPIAENV